MSSPTLDSLADSSAVAQLPVEGLGASSLVLSPAIGLWMIPPNARRSNFENFQTSAHDENPISALKPLVLAMQRSGELPPSVF